jgi:hypothetical protein
MMPRRLSITCLVAAALVALVAGCAAADSRINLADSPPTVFETIPYEVGGTYTLGESGVPPEVPRPVRITGIEVVHSRGIEVLGSGAFEPDPDGTGSVPGWPPPGINLTLASDLPSMHWPGAVETVLGIRTTAPKSGLRGIEVRWVDGTGVAGGRTFDIAVYTCAPGACEVAAGDADELLRELGLLR